MREWTVRIEHEWKSFNYKGLFLTLTYSNEHLPLNDMGYATLRPNDLVKYWKRVRKLLSKHGRKIKYFACGEYGESCKGKEHFPFGRPHYHAIVLGVDYNDVELLRNEWLLDDNADWRWALPHYDPIQRKVVSYAIGDITTDSISYVCGYVQKKWCGKKFQSPFQSFGCVPPFQRQSQGFGLNYLQSNAFELIRNGNVKLNKKHKTIVLGLPKYYKEKLGLCGLPARLLRGKLDSFPKEVQEVVVDYFRRLQDAQEGYLSQKWLDESKLRSMAWKHGLRGVYFDEYVHGMSRRSAEELLRRQKESSFSKHFNNIISEVDLL